MATRAEASSQVPTAPHGRSNKRRRSFTEALKEKYCSEENWDTDGFAIDIVLTGKPRNKEGDAELSFLTNVVLDRSSVSYAGIPDTGLVSLCPNVVDLDLANNLIENWGEILPIFSELPHLKFVNLSKNKFKQTEVLQHWTLELPSIENVVLNNTGIAWEDVTRLAQFMPHLKELHVCKNGYSKLSEERLHALKGVECLRLNENRITRWEEVWKLRSLPQLTSLILSGNPLLEIFYTEPSETDDPELTNWGEGTSRIDEKQNENIVHRNGRHCSESSVNSIDNELRDIELNFDHSDTDETIENPEENGGTIDEEIDDSTITDQCNSFVEDVMLKVIGQILENENEEDMKNLNTNDHQGLSNGHCQGQSNGQCQGQLKDQSQGHSESDGQGHNSSEERSSSNFSTPENSPRRKSLGFGLGQSPRRCPWCKDGGKHDVNDIGMSLLPFSQLRILCVSETLLSKWSDLEALAKFPKLWQLRVKDVSLLCHVPMEERRKLFLASLPKIISLNGSEVAESERDKSERHFIRYFGKMKRKPERYNELVEKHGKLKPLKEVDIGYGFQEWARLGLVYKGIKVHEEVIHVVEPIGKLRQFISRKLFLPMNSFRMLHCPCGEGHKNQHPDLEELRLDSLPMSRFDFMDGDEIHIDEDM